ncbi:MAG TPA: hypothetical protein VGB67_04080 [Fibrella sp.]
MQIDELTLSEGIAIIPKMPEFTDERWAMVWRTMSAIQTDNDLLRMELSFYKSLDTRKKWAGEYVEEAVASVYGINRLAFYGTNPKGKKPQMAVHNEARFILYTILHHIIGVPVVELTNNYGSTVWNHIVRWRNLFTLIHQNEPITNEKDKALYDQYAPKYKQVYQSMRQTMTDDGYWLDGYTYELA